MERQSDLLTTEVSRPSYMLFRLDDTLTGNERPNLDKSSDEDDRYTPGNPNAIAVESILLALYLTIILSFSLSVRNIFC